MRKFIAAAIAAAALSFPIASASADAPNCTIPVTEGSSVISPGANDCIVRYATEDEAVAVVTQARADGLFVWYADGVVVFDGQGYVVRVSNYGTPEFFLVNFPPAA